MRKMKLTWGMIQKITNRSPDTLNTILNSTTTTLKTKGRPKKIPAKILPKILKVTTMLQKTAKAQEVVTADMILQKAGVSACAHTAEHLQEERHQIQEIERRTCFY